MEAALDVFKENAVRRQKAEASLKESEADAVIAYSP